MDKAVQKREHCCGCTVCYTACPKSAIKMNADGEGFLYPHIDKTICVDCGLCEEICPRNTDVVIAGYSQKYYAVQHNDGDVVLNSSSGGMFTALSDAVLERGGVVYGAAFDGAFSVKHDRAATKEERDCFRGSKYVQSNMLGIMQRLVDDLDSDIPVMFTGTPCQVAGVRNYVQKRRKSLNGLLLCDFVCHGVSSPLTWSAYVGYLQEKHMGALQLYNFRGKDDGWTLCYPQIVVDKQNVSKAHREKASYLKFYSTCVAMRPSCYSCPWTTYDRCSDITLADFWNIGKAHPEMNDDRGTSQVIINTEIGEQWFSNSLKYVRCKECSKADAWQPHLEFPSSRPKNRDKFWREFADLPFETVIKKYGKDPITVRCRRAIMPLISKLGLYSLAGKAYKVIFVRQRKEGSATRE